MTLLVSTKYEKKYLDCIASSNTANHHSTIWLLVVWQGHNSIYVGIARPFWLLMGNKVDQTDRKQHRILQQALELAMQILLALKVFYRPSSLIICLHVSALIP